MIPLLDRQSYPGLSTNATNRHVDRNSSAARDRIGYLNVDLNHSGNFLRRSPGIEDLARAPAKSNRHKTPGQKAVSSM